MSTTEPPDDSADDSAPETAAPETTEPVPTAATWSASTSTTPAVPPSPPPDPPTAPSAPAPAWAPAPPAAWTTPPKPKRRLTWLWVLIGALSLIAVLVVVGVVLFIRTLAGPMDATEDVLAQIKAGNYTEAYRISCAEDRELYTVDQYARIFTDTVDQRGAIESYDVNFSEVDGAEAEVRYDLEFAGGDSRRYRAAAHKVDGEWRVCLFADDESDD